VNRAEQVDPVEETVDFDQEEEIEEIFGRLWSIPKPKRARVSERKGNGGGGPCLDPQRLGERAPLPTGGLFSSGEILEV
jgi:hypothetical protein